MTSVLVRSSSSALPILKASGLNISGKSGPSITCIVCSGLTYKLPAPPTTSSLVSVPPSRSQRCLREVLCCGSNSGAHAPNASTTASKPAKSEAVKSKRSLLITFFAADLFSPRTTAVTSRPLSIASCTISFPSFPFAHTTAIFIIISSFCFISLIGGLLFSACKIII